MEAALLTDPENGELLKLKEDLVEVIELTRDLIKTQLEDAKKTSYVESNKSYATELDVDGGGGRGESSSDTSAAVAAAAAAAAASVAAAIGDDSNDSNDMDDVEAALLAAEKGTTRPIWKIGDKCQAKWTEDSNYYDATIEGISETGEVSVVFEAYQNRCTTTLAELRERVARNEVFPSNK